MPSRPPVHRRNLRHRALVSLSLAAVVALAGFVGLAGPAAAGPQSVPPGFASGQAALDRLAARLPSVALEHGIGVSALAELFTDDPTLAVDASGGLAYFDPAPPADAPLPSASKGGKPDSTAAPTAFQLASLSGADKTIYLDFDGHVTTGTAWNEAYGVDPIASPAFDLDGVPGTFSSIELAAITTAWQIAAEDYAAFNVNVTTIDPGIGALQNSGAGDLQWGVRVVVTRDLVGTCGCGGQVYVGSFDDPTDLPAFVYNTSGRTIGEAVSHEAGHTLNLAHDGTLTSGYTYYSGHGDGETSWAPIMGYSYGNSVTTWSRQEYPDANNTSDTANYGNGADDIAVLGSLTNGNNVGFRLDDVGDTAAAARVLSGRKITVDARIGTRADVDVFAFTSGGGRVTVNAVPLATPTGDLDLALTIRNATGAVVATADNPLSRPVSWSGPLAAGTYTVGLDGVGAGDPTVSPPTGYSDYASEGQYTLTLSGTR